MHNCSGFSPAGQVPISSTANLCKVWLHPDPLKSPSLGTPKEGPSPSHQGQDSKGLLPCQLVAQLHLSSYTPWKAGAASPPRGRVVAAHPSSVPAPKVQHTSRHCGGHHGWCWGTLLLAFCILDGSISGERTGREPRVAATGTLTGHGGNAQPRGHRGRSWRRG